MCIRDSTVAQVFETANLFQDSSVCNNFCPYGISSTNAIVLVLIVDICNPESLQIPLSKLHYITNNLHIDYIHIKLFITSCRD